MKIISIAHHHKDAHDFAMCVVDDDMAAIHFERCQTANSENRFSLAMFSPDSPGSLLEYIRRENEAQKART